VVSLVSHDVAGPVDEELLEVPFNAPGLAPAANASSTLVAHGSAHGSTKGVAERIAAGLAEHGTRVEVRPVKHVDDIRASRDSSLTSRSQR
jgi:hypothetical protein